MNSDILNHFLKFSTYTDPGLYKSYLEKFPDEIPEIGRLLHKQIIHPNVVKNGNTGTNADMRYGDISKIPWYKEKQDATLTTVSSILAELVRLDDRGFVYDRNEDNKLILSCRSISILVASILKLKGIPCRVRSGFAPYFTPYFGNQTGDHWINQYWDKSKERWVTIDVDGFLEDYVKFDLLDIPEGEFDFSAKCWLDVREGKVDAKHFHNSGGTDGLIAICWELFYDFHCFMNNEILYTYSPKLSYFHEFYKQPENVLKEVDELARLMIDPDKNFDKLKEIWETKKEFRLVVV
ncbi:MAG: transglutaminase domain-containing protein [bacterium]